jgi:hypothetical protein
MKKPGCSLNFFSARGFEHVALRREAQRSRDARAGSGFGEWWLAEFDYSRPWRAALILTAL